jgi:hypothetical protein
MFDGCRVDPSTWYHGMMPGMVDGVGVVSLGWGTPVEVLGGPYRCAYVFGVLRRYRGMKVGMEGGVVRCRRCGVWERCGREVEGTEVWIGQWPARRADGGMDGGGAVKPVWLSCAHSCMEQYMCKQLQIQGACACSTSTCVHPGCQCVHAVHWYMQYMHVCHMQYMCKHPAVLV